MADLDKHKRHVETFLNITQVARASSEKARDYVNHQQWTEQEAAKLRSRFQAPIVVNRVKPKVEGLKGLLIQRKTDPKAYPRTQEHEEAAHAATDALRFVADNVDFDETKLAVADDFFVEGYGGAITEVKQLGNGEVEISISRIPWDRIFYDVHSRRHDFKDAKYMGVIIWADADEATAMAKALGATIDLDAMQDASDFETFDDRPRWVEGNEDRKRVRIAQEYFLEGDVWHLAIYTGEQFLMEPRPSPLLDDEGEPSNPIELLSAHMDRENNRFGEVTYWMDLQDEINHRRSAALNANKNRQTMAPRGAVEDVPAMKRELSKFDGHVEYVGEVPPEMLPTGDMAQAQFDLLAQATAEIDAVGFNAQLAGERQGNLSGKAILALQGAGSNELSPQFNRINGWEKRIYRQVWSRIRQFWTAEKWIRVTDDDRSLRWAGFNVPMTTQQILEEKINDESLDEFTRKRASEIFMQMMETQDPRLQEVRMVRNEVAALDMDIILEQALDTVNVQQEQFELLATLAQNRPEVPFTTLLQLSTMRDKETLIAKIEEGEQNQAALLQAQQEQAAAALEADTQAKITLDQAQTKNELDKDLILNQQKIEANERLKAAELAFEREKANISKDLTTHEGSVTRDSRTIVEIPDAGRLAEAMNTLAESQQGDTETIGQLLLALDKPREVQRDEEGRVVALV